MPIGDLLAEISGGQSSSSAPSPKATTSSGIKRKAEDGSNGGTSTKLTKARQPDGSYSTMKAAAPGQTALTNSSTLPHRTNPPSTNGRSEPPTARSQRIVPTLDGRSPAAPSNATQLKRHSEASSRSKLNQNASAPVKAAASKPPPISSIASNSSQAPKKGSFKEIMARGAKAQEVMGKVGMIQHKSTDKAVAKKEREVGKAEHKPGISSAAKGKTGTSYTGTGRSSGAGGRDPRPLASSARPEPRSGPAKDAKTSSKSKSASTANDVPEKKVKKSATATTGYAGTARPRPGASANKGSSRGDQRPRHGGLLEPPRIRRAGKYEDDEDDLDDFIEYDEEDDQEMGPRYGYDSDGSSDMEAGLSDIDIEERRAEVFAREEDKREQALEEKLKKEKEERRRRWANGGR
ncbi:hypothetical protein SAMD00023353_0104460 [Rosellinia necatrix]|uniref:SPT2 chromatin protein n=1 Tax=Rosellinia necatrix TaxID=77044 RepID=A0A1S7UIV3_ROSNE|nr:hypothetical protein SAMD00023353_0104460 [Rosellinia necatrix]